MNIKTGFRILFCLFLFLAAVPSLGANCADPCDSSEDCTSPSCKYCDPNAFNTCNSCCDFSDLGASECPSPCSHHPSTGQCRNISGVDCSGVPEVSRPAQIGLWIVFAAVGFFAAFSLKRLRAKRDLRLKK